MRWRVPRVAAPYGSRRVLGDSEEEARAHACLRQRGTRPRLPHRRTSKRMKPAINDASARQHAGEPSPVRHRNGNRHDRPRRPDLTEVARQIAGLANRSTQDLRVAWRQLHRTGPPLGLSRDLLIRALAHQLQEQSYGGVSRVLRRRLQSLGGASEKGALAVAPGLVLKAGTTLVRQWRAHAHTVLVHKYG